MLWNPFAFTVHGDAVPPAAPPALRVLGGQQATAQQLSFAQQTFYQFCSRARLSLVANPMEQGRLPDGTPYRIVVIGPQTVMEIWPGAEDLAVDSESAIYVAVLAPGDLHTSRFLMRPKGGVGRPGRPWRVQELPADGGAYGFVQNDAPWPHSRRLYGQGVDVTWHGTQGKEKKNYLVYPVTRGGAPVAVLSVAGARNNVPKGFSIGGISYFGNLIIDPAEIRHVVYAAAPFEYAEAPPVPPYLIPVGDTVVFACADNGALHEHILGVSEHTGGAQVLLLVQRIANPRPDPPPPLDPGIDEFGRHEHIGCVTRETLVGAQHHFLEVTLSTRSIADPDFGLAVDEYRRQGLAWSRTSSENAKRAGSCSPPRFRIAHSPLGAPTFADMCVVHENSAMPPMQEVETSGPDWTRRRSTLDGVSRFRASSSATYDELVAVQRFTRAGGKSTVRTWGNEDYSAECQVSRVVDALYFSTVGSVTEYHRRDEVVDYAERRRVEQGLMLGNRRLVTFKTDVSMAGGATRKYRSDNYSAPRWDSEAYAGSVSLSALFEGRSVVAYDPFLDLLCYTECVFDYSANFEAERQVHRGPVGVETDEASGSDCFLPITEPPAVDLVIECRGQDIRIPIPPLSEAEADHPDDLYREKAQKIAWFSVVRYFDIPGYRPANHLSDADYTRGARGNVAGGLFDVQGGYDIGSVFGTPSGVTASFNRNRLCFGAMCNPAAIVSADYATDPRTGGAVIAFRWRGRVRLAYAIDSGGIRPLGDILPGINPEHIDTIGSA